MRDEDDNTRLFHQSIKQRKMKNQIYNINDERGVWHDNSEAVSEAFLAYYKMLWGQMSHTELKQYIILYNMDL